MLFENVVIVEALKFRLNRGYQPNLWFCRDSQGLECDMLYETGYGIRAFEIKSASTIRMMSFVRLIVLPSLYRKSLLKPLFTLAVSVGQELQVK